MSLGVKGVPAHGYLLFVHFEIIASSFLICLFVCILRSRLGASLCLRLFFLTGRSVIFSAMDEEIFQACSALTSFVEDAARTASPECSCIALIYNVSSCREKRETLESFWHCVCDVCLARCPRTCAMLSMRVAPVSQDCSRSSSIEAAFLHCSCVLNTETVAKFLFALLSA